MQTMQEQSGFGFKRTVKGLSMTSKITRTQKLSVHAEINHKASIGVFGIISNGHFDWKPAC